MIEDTFYNIISIENGIIKTKSQRGEVYKTVFGIQAEHTLYKSVCFRVTHIPSGYLLTRLYFLTSKEAKKYVDWFTEGILDTFNTSDINKIKNDLKDTEKAKKQNSFESKFGDKAVKFGL